MGRNDVDVQFHGPWDRVIRMLSHGVVEREFEEDLDKATGLNAQIWEGKSKELISSGRFHENADLTIALKGSSRPLVDSGDLIQSITTKREDTMEWDVGVFREKTSREGVNVALHVHEGATIDVSKDMRQLFEVLFLATTVGMNINLEGRALELFEKNPGVKWKPLKPTTTQIRIPPREFLADVLDDRNTVDKMIGNYTRAVLRYFELVSEGRKRTPFRT